MAMAETINFTDIRNEREITQFSQRNHERKGGVVVNFLDEKYRRERISHPQRKHGLIDEETVAMCQDRVDLLGYSTKLDQRVEVTFSPEDQHFGYGIGAIVDNLWSNPGNDGMSISLPRAAIKILEDYGISPRLVTPQREIESAPENVVFLSSFSQFDNTDTTPEPA